MNKLLKLKNVSLLIVALLVLISAAIASSYQIHIYLDGRLLTLNQPAMVMDGRVMVPMRGVFENLGAEVMYDPLTHLVTATRADTIVELSTITGETKLNGEVQNLDTPPFLSEDTLMIPLRFVNQALKADTVWVAGSDKIMISSRTGGIDVTNPGEKLSLPVENVEAPPVPAIAPMSVMLASPVNGGYVPENFEINGTTAPWATVHVTVIGHQTSSWEESSSPSNSVLLDTDVTADSSGNFAAPVDTGYLPSNSQITITTRAKDDLGRLATNVTNVTLSF